jgi:hypothetical protein
LISIKNLLAACPLEGLVRSVLACRQVAQVEFRTDVDGGIRHKMKTDREQG